MFAFLGKLLVGPIVARVFDIFKLWQQGKMTELELRTEVEKAVLDTVSDVSRTQADVIMAEMRGENWLQRNWRPIVALCFAFIVLFYGIITPVMVAWYGWAPVRVGDQLLGWIMNAVMVCLGGYIGGRSLEKIIKTIVYR